MIWHKHYFLCALSCVFWAAKSTQYKDLSYYSVNAALDTLKGHFASISNANEQYGLSFSKEGPLTCSPYIVSISEVHSLKQDSTRPQVLISGEIHGDERVGPGVSVALSQLLVWSAQCTIHKIIESCNSLDLMHITAAQRNWLTLLATRRQTIVVPTANCMGYMRYIRADGAHDPNRDYPYSRKDDRCFKSSSAKLFKALMETTIVQLVVTFHGGMVALGYEWGSRNHLRPRDSSPDDNAHQSIADRMKLYAGSFHNEKPYPVGRINTLIYPVDGGMEDWLYAAGWDKAQLHHCAGIVDTNYYYAQALQLLSGSAPSSPSIDDSLGGEGGENPRRRASILDAPAAAAENRAVVFLVETSDRKKPLDTTLGGTENILDPSAEQNGHIPRNVRLSLAAIDMAQPYVCVHSVKMLYEPASSEGKVAHGFGFRASRKEGRLRRANGGPGPGTGARRLQFSTLLVNFTAGETFSTEAQPTRTSDFDAETSGTESHINNNSIYNSSINGTVVAGIEVEWYVGGASVVDCTFLAWHLPPPPGSAPTTPNIDPAQAQLSTADWTHYMTTLEAPGLTDKFLSTCKRDIAESPLHLRAADRRHNYNIYRDRGYLQQSFPILASPSFAGESRWKASSDGSAVARESSSTYTEAEEVKSSTATHVADDVTRPLTTYKASVQPAFHMVGNAKVHSTVAFPPGRYLLVSWSMVDQHFGEPQQGYPSDLGPQSHLANVRTNPRYHKTVGDRIAQGRLFWPSDPLEVVVSSNGTYYVASTVIHGAWWDRQHHGNMHVDDNSQLYATGLEPEKTNSTLYGAGTVATDLLRNIFDTAAYLPAGEMQGNVKRLYVISFGLLLITGVCCVVLYYQWRRSSIYSQVANNKNTGGIPSTRKGSGGGMRNLRAGSRASKMLYS